VGVAGVLAFGVVVAALAVAGEAWGQDARGATAPAGDTAAVRSTLQTLVGQLVSSDRTMRRAAARSIDTLGAPATSAMASELARLRPGRPAPEIAAVLARARGTGDAADREGRLDALLDLPPEAAGPAYGQAVTTLCLLRALGHIATPDAVATLAPLALDARGAFAAEVRRQLVDLGERATAGLVLMSHSHAPAAERWASSELEALGKRTPGDAVQTRDKQVLADVLRTYGRVRDADALPVVMSFVNADHRVVREASREALGQYADEAVPKLRESYGLLTGEAPPTDWPPVWLRRQLFEALDRIRNEDVDARVAAGLALTRDGRFAEAVASFDDVLARQPDMDHKAELVPAYVFLAQSIAGSDPTRARELLDKALRLDPSGPRTAQIQSALALLEGRDLERRGVVEEEPFRRALALDPSNAAAGAELLRIDDERRARKKVWTWRVIEAVGALCAVCVLILFVRTGGRRRRA
jgi:tetratricopeptide (TPR) repeat protein